MKILVIAPHCDDAEFGCGGMIARRVQEGHDVRIVVLTKGDTPMLHSGKLASDTVRRVEQTNSAFLLGVERVFYLNLSKILELDKADTMTAVRGLDYLIKDVDQVFTPLPSQHADHEAAWKLCLAAYRPGRKLPDLYAYELPGQDCGPTIWGTCVPCVHMPLTSVEAKKKIAALACHESQVKGREAGLYGFAGVEALMRLRGMECGETWAERFHPIRIRM